MACTFYIATITADHEFDKVMGAEAYLTEQAAQAWADQRVADLLLIDRAYDPSFDCYAYTIRVQKWVMQG
jgi:hypothetical protein